MQNDSAALKPLTVDVAEAAVLLGVSQYSVRRMLASGELRCVRIGTLIRIPMAAVEEFLIRPASRTPSGPSRGGRSAGRPRPNVVRAL